jgi:hypothetical protein
MEQEPALKLARELVDAGMLDLLDERRQWYRFCRPPHRSLHHAEVLAELLQERCRRPSELNIEEMAEAESAYDVAQSRQWNLAALIGKTAATLLLRRGRNAEAVEWLHRLAAGAESNGDAESLEFAADELSWISDSPWQRRGATSDLGLQLKLEFAG